MEVEENNFRPIRQAELPDVSKAFLNVSLSLGDHQIPDEVFNVRTSREKKLRVDRNSEEGKQALHPLQILSKLSELPLRSENFADSIFNVGRAALLESVAIANLYLDATEREIRFSDAALGGISKVIRGDYNQLERALRGVRERDNLRHNMRVAKAAIFPTD